MRVVFAGGGTGGHLYPAIVVADELEKRYAAEIAFVGTADRLETTIVPAAGYHLETISAKPFSKSPSFIGANLSGILQSFRLMRALHPDIVIATGGYVCFPFVLAARLSRPGMPIFLIEPNVQPGLTNRMLSPFVTEVWHEVPLRKEFEHIRDIPKAAARKRLGLDAEKRVLLVTGGSQGARSINAAAVELVEKRLLPDGWQVLLIAGKLQTPIPSTPNLRTIEYLETMWDAYAAADLVLARAGASTIAELRVAGVPGILVPLPAAKVHQEANAQAFARDGHGIVISNSDLTAVTLARAIAQASELPVSPPVRDREDALSRILARIEGVLSRKQR